jgi:cyclomaltodextrinase
MKAKSNHLADIVIILWFLAYISVSSESRAAQLADTTNIHSGAAGVDPEEEVLAENELKTVTLRYVSPKGEGHAISVAGTFNDWSDSRNPMTDVDGDSVYEAILLLPIGEYQYKIVVDRKFETDLTAKEFADDGQGGKNSILRVDAAFPAVRFAKGDGSITVAEIPFRLDYSMVNPRSRGKTEFRTKAYQDDIEHVYLVYGRIDGEEQTTEMMPEERDGIYQYYHAILNVQDSSKIHFTFYFRDAETEYYATPGGFQSQKPAANKMFSFSQAAMKAFTTPEWAKNGVFYQIFPDRFRNGDRSNDQDFHEKYYEGATKLPPGGKTNEDYFHFMQNWDNQNGLTISPYRTDGRPDYYSFYGGDIAGVMEKIPYLKDLGVTIIYFNPLNEARSNHKYDPMDYLRIDPHFADEKTFQMFVTKAHEAGIRIIVDMAFNHTGNWHFAFVDSKEKGKESKYWNWYEWHRWPLPPEGPPIPCDYYDCWWGYPIHPNLNFDLSRPNDKEDEIVDISQAQPNWPMVNYLLKVPGYWLGTLGIDGFRLDVPNEVPFWFWKEFRKAVDACKPEAFLIGEIWGNAMPWLGPNCFHSTMNYKYFRDPVIKFFAANEGTAQEFDRELAPGRMMYPIQATEVMMNLIDSHDTERLITIAGGDARRLKLAALFQMTYLGIPQIYYGDEVGLKGGKDPDNRRTFPWNWSLSDNRKGIHEFYRKIVTIRHRYSALRTGRFQTLLTNGRTYAFLREDERDRIVVVLNNELAEQSIAIPLTENGSNNEEIFKDAISEKTCKVDGGMLKIDLEPLSGAVLVLEKAP